MTLTLKHIGTVYTDMAGTADDWLVLDDGVEVGRIYKGVHHTKPWWWGTLAVPNTGHDRGHADTLDDAKAAFKARWERMAEEQRNSARDPAKVESREVMTMSKSPNELYDLIGTALIDKNGKADGTEEVAAAVWAWIRENFEPIPHLMPVFTMMAEEKSDPEDRSTDGTNRRDDS